MHWTMIYRKEFGKVKTYPMIILEYSGCRAFVYIPEDERSKLDNKTGEYISFGYKNDEFGYRLWDPIEKKLVKSRECAKP
jgi:hypothetical protein